MSELLRHRPYADTSWNHTGYGSSLEIPTDVLRLKRYPNNSAEAAAAEAAAAVAAAAVAAAAEVVVKDIIVEEKKDITAEPIAAPTAGAA